MSTYNDEIESGRLCKNCEDPIPETKRIDTVFCSPRCGWRYRNHQTRKKRADQISDLRDDQFEENYNLIDFLYQRGVSVISQQALIEFRFNPEAYSGLKDIDEENGITEFKIRDYILTLNNDRVTIKQSI